jgi:hypothetical protein
VLLGRIDDLGATIGMVEQPRIVRAFRMLPAGKDVQAGGAGAFRILESGGLDAASRKAFALSRRRCWRSALDMAVSPMGLRLMAHLICDASRYHAG